MKEALASEIIVEQQKEIIDITELFKQLLTVVPYDKLAEMETLCKREASIWCGIKKVDSLFSRIS